MATNWGIYDARINIQGSTNRERDLNKLKKDILQKAVNSASYKTCYIGDIEKNLIISSTSDPYVKTFSTMPDDEVAEGSVIDIFGGEWLTTAIDLDDEIYTSGKIEFCNYTLNFLNSNNQPISRACIVENATKYNSGVKATSGEIKMNLGSSQYLIRLPYDSETALLDRTYPDGVDRRLLMDFGTLEPTAYTITQADRVTYPCIVALTLTESGRSTKDDNTTLMIADYYNRIASTSPVGDYIISFSGEPIIEVGKGFKTFTHNAPLTSIWKVVTVSSEYDAYVIKESAGNYIKLKILDRVMIGQIVRLNLCDASNKVLTSLDLEVRGIG